MSIVLEHGNVETYFVIALIDEERMSPNDLCHTV